MSDVTVREICSGDAYRGLLETMACLSEVGGLSSYSCSVLASERYASAASGRYPLVITFVAETEGRIVGTASLLVEKKLIHCGGLSAHLEDVVVHKDYQGRGIGKQLVERCVSEAESLGCYKLILNCEEHNTQFYQALGFRPHETGMRLDFGLRKDS